MSNTWNDLSRDINIRASITTIQSGSAGTYTYHAQYIGQYTVDEDSADSGLAFGTASSASFSLQILRENGVRNISASEMLGATVEVEIGLHNGSSYVYQPFGKWYVYSVDVSQQSLFATLHGYDALYGAFNDKFVLNTYSTYTTLGTLLHAICENVGVTASNYTTFLNHNTQPSYASVGNDVSLRGIIGYIAACAGGFARMTRDGELEIVSYADSRTPRAVSGSAFFHFTTDSPFAFQLNRIQYGKSGETLASKAISTDLPASAANTIQVIDNPFFTAGVADSLKTAFTSNVLSTYGATLEWRGDPTFLLGGAISVTDIGGGTPTVFIPTSQRFTLRGGLKCESSTVLSESYGETTNYAAVGNAITQSGELNGSRLVADSVTARAIAAGAITANEIGAGVITADKIASGTITGDKISAGAITAAKIASGAVTADKLSVGAISADIITTGTLSAQRLLIHDENVLSNDSLVKQINNAFSSSTADSLKINGNCIKANTISSLDANSKIILNENQCKISSANTLISVPQTDETDRDIVRINEEGLTAEVISSPSVAPAKTGGSFTVGTSGSYPTLSAALADFSYCCLRGDVTITVSSADNGGELIGVYGGNITIQSAISRVTVASLTVRGCASTVTIKNLSVTNGISVIGSNVEVTGCLLSCSTALYARMSNVIMDNNDGDSAVCVDARASNVHLYQTYPKGTFNGGQVYKDENAQQSGTSSPTPHTEKTKYTKSYTANHAGSSISDGGRGYNNGDIRQGASSTTKFTGACWFGGASQGSIAESNPTLTGMRLTISRVSGFGGSSATTVKIWGVGNAYSSGVTPSRITDSYITLSPKIGNGATVTYSLDINSDLAKGIFAFLRGASTTYKPGFVFFNNEAIASPYSANYCNISGLKSGNPPVLTVEYEA